VTVRVDGTGFTGMYGLPTALVEALLSFVNGSAPGNDTGGSGRLLSTTAGSKVYSSLRRTGSGTVGGVSIALDPLRRLTEGGSGAGGSSSYASTVYVSSAEGKGFTPFTYTRPHAKGHPAGSGYVPPYLQGVTWLRPPTPDEDPYYRPDFVSGRRRLATPSISGSSTNATFAGAGIPEPVVCIRVSDGIVFDLTGDANHYPVYVKDVSCTQIRNVWITKLC
jgi:hypothetical protein